MFFNKGNKSVDNPKTEAKSTAVPYKEVKRSEPVQTAPETAYNKTPKADEPKSSYAFYKPNPYPKELVSVLKNMLQRLFPDTKKAYLLEAQHSNKKGYLLIVDIDSKFLKIINIYLDSETKRVRGDMPIECVLFSKSGSLTEGIDPFLIKETAESKANNLASKEFSGDIAFSEMPEFDLWNSKKEKPAEDAAQDEPDISDEKETAQIPSKENVSAESEAKNEENVCQETEKQETDQASQGKNEIKPPVSESTKISDKTKVKPSTKKELFGLLNEYGAKKSGTVSTVAMAAIKEYEFYIPYTYNKAKPFDEIDNTLPISENIRFKKLINLDDDTKAVPLFTEKEDAIAFANKDNCRIVILKYKDFASSRAAELTGHSGIVINPDDEAIYLSSTHPLLG